MAAPEYPQDQAAWRTAIETGIGLSHPEGTRALRAGTFPYARVDRWIRATFADGYSPDFVPALTRNLRGLVDWAYGEGAEPWWPGADQKAQ